MICTFCLKDKLVEEFYTNHKNGIISKTCKQCFNLKYYRNENYPQARCERCEKRFQLEFDPKKNPNLIPKKWQCDSCRNSLNIL